ncbi:hypothetical protein J8273_3926 [Carpediemonas membranifera]|uniref:Uncharacterized protein n=1 Tax=Carpediemonas membranifera TaxID=201153 RepID=A0A8J6B2F3_9EUKA|nr:hypothetical protein J8273_3926 [Carpediemonas membranifera]|eukprot:KAG9394293.1 hypothetical protein J8273_3926 [Carpediemonas membranifera]
MISMHAQELSHNRLLDHSLCRLRHQRHLILESVGSSQNLATSHRPESVHNYNAIAHRDHAYCLAHDIPSHDYLFTPMSLSPPISTFTWAIINCMTTEFGPQSLQQLQNLANALQRREAIPNMSEFPGKLNSLTPKALREYLLDRDVSDKTPQALRDCFTPRVLLKLQDTHAIQLRDTEGRLKTFDEILPDIRAKVFPPVSAAAATILARPFAVQDTSLPNQFINIFSGVGYTKEEEGWLIQKVIERVTPDAARTQLASEELAIIAGGWRELVRRTAEEGEKVRQYGQTQSQRQRRGSGRGVGRARGGRGGGRGASQGRGRGARTGSSKTSKSTQGYLPPIVV